MTSGTAWVGTAGTPLLRRSWTEGAAWWTGAARGAWTDPSSQTFLGSCLLTLTGNLLCSEWQAWRGTSWYSVRGSLVHTWSGTVMQTCLGTETHFCSGTSLHSDKQPAWRGSCASLHSSYGTFWQVPS